MRPLFVYPVAGPGMRSDSTQSNSDKRLGFGGFPTPAAFHSPTYPG